MIKHIIIILNFLTIFYLSPVSCSQIFFESQVNEKKTPKQLQGYVKYEFYGDSYQVIGYQSNEDLQSPRKKLLDKNGKDINARGQLTQNAIETRFRFTFVTDNIKELEAKATAVIEADFFGLAVLNASELSGECRFRHAYILFERENMSLLAGHFWNPTTLLDCYPNTISFDGGAPYEPSSRNPVVMYTLKHKKTEFIVAAVSQLTLSFVSDGPDGYSNKYMRNAILPDMHVQVKQKIDLNTFGIGYDLKRLAPRLVTNDNVKTNESILSSTIFAYYSFVHPHFVFCAKYAFCQNGTDYGVYGGYGVHSINPVNDKRTYVNTATSNLWFDVELHLPNSAYPGLFFGYAYNHGAQETILPDVVGPDGVIVERMIYGLDPSVQQSLRIQPRVRFKYDPVVFGLELEVTATAFGTRDKFARIHDAEWTLNGRILGAIFYLF